LKAASRWCIVRGCSQTVYENVLTKVNSEYGRGEGATPRARGRRSVRFIIFPTKEQVAATLIEQYVTELEAAFDRLSEEVPLLNVSVVAGRLTTLFVAFRTTYPAFVVLVDARDVVLPGGTGERLRKGIASVLAALAPRLSVKEALFRAVVVQHLMKAAVTLTHDASVVNHHAAILEFQHVVEHYLEDVMEAARGGRTGAAQRGTAPKERSASGNGAGPKSKSKGKIKPEF
jgi:hypothetical protein